MKERRAWLKVENFKQDVPMKLNNKGATLVELIVVMAISSIVLVMIGTVISFGSRSYTVANREAKMQMDSQVVLSQIEELIIEANKIVSYTLTGNRKAYLLFYNNSVDVLVHDINTKKLYYEDDITVGNTVETNTSIDYMNGMSYSDKENLMAENISDIYIEKLTPTKDKIVTVSLIMSIGGNERTFIKQITLRNTITLNNNMILHTKDISNKIWNLI